MPTLLSQVFAEFCSSFMFTKVKLLRIKKALMFRSELKFSVWLEEQLRINLSIYQLLYP
jgi:hypothetical protein